MKKPRLVSTILVGTACASAAAGIPLPHHVYCDVFLQTRGAATAYVESPGIVEEIHVQPGDFVRAGVPLLTLENIDLQRSIARLLGEQSKLFARLRSLRQRAFEDENAGVEIAEVEESLSAVAEQLSKRKQEIQKLQILAPRDGSVIPVADRPKPDQEKRLPSWHGTPLARHNLSAYLKEGVPVCQIGDPHRLEAVLAVDQGMVEFVRKGQQIDVIFDQLPGQRFRSQLFDLSHVQLEFAPASLASKSGGSLISKTDSNGQERPAQTTYQASAPIDDNEGTLFVGATGKARIRTRHQTLAQRAWRFICQTFSFNA